MVIFFNQKGGKMSEFHQQLLNQAKSIWERTVNHAFLKATADGSIDEETFNTWIQQDYLFVEAAIPFMAVLLAKAPRDLRPSFTQIIVGLEKELELFKKNAETHGISLDNVEPYPVNHAYIQFLMNTAYNKSFVEGFTVLYCAEKVYLDSWMTVKKNLKGESRWQSFIDNWAGEAFQQYVDWLTQTFDSLAEGKPQKDRQKMTDIFNMTVRYEYLFWEMANNKSGWPV
jgi:thiaminase